jgi:AcrR family transcriptional regulator
MAGQRARGRPVSEEAALARRGKLCDAALVVAMRDGVSGLTTRAVAEAAGMNAAMVAYAFESKDGLLRAVVESLHADVAATLAASIAGSRGIGPAIRMMAERYWAHVRETPDLQRVQYELTLHVLTLEGGEALAKAQYDGYVRALATALGEVAKRPVDRAALDDVAGVSVALMDGLILQWLATGDVAACERRLSLGVRMLMTSFGGVDD